MRWLVAAGAASGVAGGVYVAAAMTATSMAGTFSVTESSLNARQSETETAWRQASARYVAARAKCKALKGKRKDLCNTVAREEGKHPALPDTPTKETAP